MVEKISLMKKEFLKEFYSRFRRISENAFGIWSNRFRLFATRASLTSERAETTVMASLALHHLLRTKSRETLHQLVVSILKMIQEKS